MKNESILRSMISKEEQFYWQITGSTADWKFNPIYLLLTICTLGLFWVCFHLYRTYHYYVLTSTRLIVISGILGKRVDEVELFRIVNSIAYQSPIDRFVNIGNVKIDSTDKTGLVVMKKIPHPFEVRDTLRQVYYEARQKQGTVLLEDFR